MNFKLIILNVPIFKIINGLKYFKILYFIQNKKKQGI